MSSTKSENSGGDMAALSVNPNCDDSSVEEQKAEEHTRVPESSNGGFVPNESCSSAFGSSELSASSALIAQPLRVDSNSSSSTSHDASDGSLRTTLHHHSAVDPSSDEEESLESSLLLSEGGRECESGEIEMAEACAARDGRIDSGPVRSPVRSSNLKHTPGLQQDVLADGDMPVRQNGSGACGGGGKDSTVDQSVSDLSTQSNEWERLGARPRDRAPMKRFPVEPSLFDLVRQEVASPVTHGVADAFLAKHSVDESLYQGSTEPRGAHAALPSANAGGSMLNRDFGSGSVESTDNSLLALEQRVEEACAMVERVLREREERELFGREIEKKEREIRELRARERREREARELEEANRWPQEQEAITGRSQWLCEHYQRHRRVRRPCCSHFYLCHRCHNNSRWMQLTEVPLPFDDLIVGSLDSNHNSADARRRFAKAMTRIQQARNTEEASRCCCTCTSEEIGEDSGKCRSCGGNMSAYFCSICKHFTSVDNNPIHKDKSFHCDACNVCLDKRLEGKHKCRPDSGHDECCICLEDIFSGCQILPCSHKVHRECAIAMIQDGIRTCPVCRHPLYSSASE